MPVFIDLTGRVYGRLTVISRAPNKGRRTVFNCICSCGNSATVGAARLGKLTNSCGCIRKETAAKTSISCAKHNASFSPEYNSWAGLKDRCNNKSSKDYHRYGSRGISVCDRWLNSFENFLADMGKKPTPEYSIDRIDNAGNYTPENCRWADATVQCNNRRNNRVIVYRGVSRSLAQWCRIFNIKPPTLISRIDRGWNIDDALNKSI